MDKKRKSSLIKKFYLIHWVSGAVSLVSMLFFAVTGITLNHADEWASEPVVTEKKTVVPEAVRAEFEVEEGTDEGREIPVEFAGWIDREFDLTVEQGKPEWSDFDLYVNFEQPGGNAWISVDFESWELSYEATDRGKMSFFNDLHRGLYTGTAWSWYLDVFAVASIIFTVTGLALLAIHAARRKSTWLIVSLGIAIPVILILFFLH